MFVASSPLLHAGDGTVLPSFTADVMAVLSKAGCNAGTCHGNQNGKGGFKLSLRGQDPALDYQALARDQFGRRANPLDPDQSLLLLKPSMQLAHDGGLRLKQGSLEHEILRRWIAGGMPAEPSGAPRLERIEVQPGEQVLLAPRSEVPLTVTAHFTDGGRRNVARLAVFEPSSSIVTVSPEGRAASRNSARRRSSFAI